MDPFYITLLLSSPLLATLLPPLLLLIVPTKRMCFCVGKVLDKRVIALLSRNGQKMFPAQIVLLFQTSDFYTLSDRKDPPFFTCCYLFSPFHFLDFLLAQNQTHWGIFVGISNMWHVLGGIHLYLSELAFINQFYSIMTRLVRLSLANDQFRNHFTISSKYFDMMCYLK